MMVDGNSGSGSGSGSGSTNISLENAIKDIELMVQMAAEHGTNSDVVSSALKRYKEA